MKQVELDCRAMSCPRPIIELARVFGEVEMGDEVVAGHRRSGRRHLDVRGVVPHARPEQAEYAGVEAASDGVPVYVVAGPG